MREHGVEMRQYELGFRGWGSGVGVPGLGKRHEGGEIRMSVQSASREAIESLGG